MKGLVLRCALAATLVAFAVPALAQGKYPDKPVRVILPFGAGGVADITTRLVADKLGEKLGQRFVVENNAGGGGIAAARAVMQAPADGYTLAVFSNGTAVTGEREWLSLGALGIGGNAGLWFVNGAVGLTVAVWSGGSRLSAVGRAS